MSTFDFSLSGKVAIVTGASRGIGYSIAQGLAEAGADVAIAARKPEPLAEAVEKLKKATGRRVIGVPTSVRHQEQLRNLVDETVAQLGRLDVLVNNAGTNPIYGPVQEMDERAWDAIMDTNVKAAFFLSVMVREEMLKHGDGGSIINISSLGGVRASDVIGGYSISKAAMIMMTQVCAKTWGTDGIRVNCMGPGLIKTEFSRALWDDPKFLKNTLSQAALKRIGEADEMAGAAVYLASSASSFVTGQTLMLDGGVCL